MSYKQKIVYIATDNFTVKWYLYPIMKEISKKYDVTFISNGPSSEFQDILSEDIHHIRINIQRKINLLNDLTALWHLFWTLRKIKISCIHTIMPKSGLLGSIAGFLTNTKVRIHTFTGQPWITMAPPKKWLLILMDKVIGKLTTITMADSNSQLNFLIEKGVVNPKKSIVLGSGSICGINMDRFKSIPEDRSKFRSSLMISDSDIVFMFMGRLTIDKGILDLVDSFKKISLQAPNARLIYVGNDEDGILETIKARLENFISQFYYFPHTTTPEKYYNIADIFCLPSYREGFGSSILEAAAYGIPAIGSNIYGISDAIQDAKTGVLFPAKDTDKLAEEMLNLSRDTAYRRRLGGNAYQRTLTEFSQKIVVNNLLELYEGRF